MKIIIKKIIINPKVIQFLEPNLHNIKYKYAIIKQMDNTHINFHSLTTHPGTWQCSKISNENLFLQKQEQFINIYGYKYDMNNKSIIFQNDNKILPYIEKYQEKIQCIIENQLNYENLELIKLLTDFN